MQALNKAVKAGKVRYIGISNCFAYQLAKANALAEKEGFAKFVAVQSHYNLIFREEDREMTKLCAEDNIAMTPYSSLASGRLCKHLGETSKRLEEDAYARLKYDATEAQDNVIIKRVEEVAEAHGVSMTEVALAWLLTKVTAPVVGMTKFSQIEGAAKAVDLALAQDEIRYLEEAYVISPIRQYSPKAKRELKYYQKLYIEDVSFNSIRQTDDHWDITHNLENIVFNE